MEQRGTVSGGCSIVSSPPASQPAEGGLAALALQRRAEGGIGIVGVEGVGIDALRPRRLRAGEDGGDGARKAPGMLSSSRSGTTMPERPAQGSATGSGALSGAGSADRSSDGCRVCGCRAGRSASPSRMPSRSASQRTVEGSPEETSRSICSTTRLRSDERRRSASRFRD